MSSGHITGLRREDIDLSATLRSGQVFRWNEDADHVWHGVLDNRFPLRLQQSDSDASLWWEADAPDAEVAVRAFLRLGPNEPDLAALAETWCRADALFAEAWAKNPGIRVLRQNPDECFFAFLCASVAPIARISGMLRAVAEEGRVVLNESPETLTPLPPLSQAREGESDYCPASALHGSLLSTEAGAKPQTLSLPDSLSLACERGGRGVKVPKERELKAPYILFPTASQIAATSENRLRELGLGFRAKRVMEAARVLALLPPDHLAALRRGATHAEAKKELTTFFGVGEKIADCVCLFALDKDGAIPVDTHIWRIAVTRYAPDLAGKSLSAANYARVTQAFHDRFGPLAGWAQQTLFYRSAVGRKS